MKKQGTGIRDQGSDRIAALLRTSLPPIEDNDGESDLWPAMQRRLRAEAASPPVKISIPWFDWALAGSLVTLLALFPAWIPVMLYYL